MILKRFNGLWRATAMVSMLMISGASFAAAQQDNSTQPVTNRTSSNVTAATQSAGIDLPVVKPVIQCAALAQNSLSAIGGAGSRVTSAKEVNYNGATFCQIDGELKPTIGFQVLLPKDSWIQRYMQIGCGGLCGTIGLQIGAAAGCTPLNANGFAIAATDMGHKMQEADFGNQPQKRVDFAYRSQHLTAQVAKQLIKAYYGQSPHYAYFNGCSDGGREALMEAQRFPQDFNGVIAGAAAMNFQVQNAVYHAWQALSNTGPDGKAVIVASRLPLIHKAVLAQCDAKDGQVDGLIADPQSCHFDPKVLRCKAGTQDTQQCLSAAEVETLQRLYDGPRDPQTGEKLTLSGPMPGSELAWAGVFVPEKADDPIFSQMIALSSLKYLNYVKNPSSTFSLKDVQFTKAAFAELAKLHPLYDATNPDLKAFKDAGGKLIIWHGWADPHISPLNSVAYHQAVGSVMGAANRDAFERLYVVPGMHHCSGGEGPSQLDLLTPMMNWVEKGQAPDAVITYQAAKEASTSFGQPGGGKPMPKGGADGKALGAPPKGMKPMTQGLKLETLAPNAASRPVYPYPDYAVYSGKGDVNAASSYVRKRLGTVPQSYHWLGEDFYKPYKFMN